MDVPQQIRITINPGPTVETAIITVTPRYEASHAEIIEYLSVAAQALFATMGRSSKDSLQVRE
jgi:hypothetical protein